ncbi:protease complex subunit PrcB family protein [Deinococcus petrolearius]|uniref:Protease complex subunit PrcB family protein n=1 Tax=Deinococcus petrolearius TaxID=1751295 RepID=A0ABW1DGY6_9DEIO
MPLPRSALLALGASLLAGCSMTGPTNLRVHEVSLTGGAQERLVWVYGTLGAAGQSGTGLKIGGQAVTLRAQVRDDLALPGTLSVDGKSTFRQPLPATSQKLSVTRDAAGLFTVAPQNGASLAAVYYTDGSGWFRLSGVNGRVGAVPSAGLRGAGQLTDEEGAALGRALAAAGRGQGGLAVAVLNDPQPPLDIEPAPAETRRTALYVLPGVTATPAGNTGGVPFPGSGAGTGQPTAPVAGGNVNFTEVASGSNANVSGAAVQTASSAAAARALFGVAYGRQSGAPSVPALGSAETLVGVFLGQRATGGYGVRVVAANAQGGALTLTVAVQAPGPGSITTQALTSPWTIVRVPGTFSQVSVVDQNGQPLR